MLNTLHCLTGFLINSNFDSVQDPEILFWKSETHDQILTYPCASPAEHITWKDKLTSTGKYSNILKQWS